MFSLYDLLMLMHLFGLALGVGSATLKIILLIRCNRNFAFIPVFVMLNKTITGLIILGMILLTLSGIGWLIIEYSFTPLLIVKVIFVGLVWLLGPIIDNVVEPKFEKLAPLPQETESPAFKRIRKRYLGLEIIATGLMYAITIIGSQI